MNIGIPKEIATAERRVALVPELVSRLVTLGLEVHIQPEAGLAAGFPDQQYVDKGARLTPDPFAVADVVLKVRAPVANEIERFRENATLIGLLEPYKRTSQMELLAARHVTAFSMELMPRIARAQSMDALSAMSAIAGYKAALLAANRLPRFFPLLMTAAGTMPPARVFVIGAGVAGLEAIGTAKRLGAVVEAYDARPAVKEEVESVGARFIELGLETTGAGERGGYAKAQSPEFYKRQQQMMADHVAAADVVITAALVRGQHAPTLITEEMIRNMRPGSVIVDLAAEKGGNCALTEPGQDIVKHGVVIIGPLDIPSSMPFHASQMYARTVHNFLTHLLRDGAIRVDMDDEVVRSTLVTYRGKIVSKEILERRSP